MKKLTILLLLSLPLFGQTQIVVAPGTSTGGGTGTVTSVGISGASGMTVTGSPVTGSGVISLSWTSQTNSFVLAAPLAGGNPVFRLLTVADIPTAAPITSPTFLTSANAPTPATSDNSTSIATTAFVNLESVRKDTTTAQTMLGPLLLPDGTAANPSLAFSNDTGLGLRRISSGTMGIAVASQDMLNLSASQIRLGASISFAWSSNNANTGGADTVLLRAAAANPRWGGSSGTPVAYTHDLATSSRALTDTDVAGANATLRPGNGTGTGGSGSLIFQTAPSGSTGNAADTMTTALTIDKTGTATHTAPVLFSDGSAGSPSAGFASDADGTGTGIFREAANTLGISANGSQIWRMNGTGSYTSAEFGIGNSVANPFVRLTGQAVHTLAQVSGVNAQTFRLFNTTDSNTVPVNAEYATFDWSTSSNVLTIGTVKLGTGTQRNVNINTGSSLNLQVAGTTKWLMNATSIQPFGDNAFDIGAGVGGRIRTLYVATSIQAGAVKTLTEGSATGFATIAIPNSGGCAAKIVYTVFAADATNTQLVSGEEFVSAAATSSGTVTAATLSDVNKLNPVTSGTLTNTMTQTTGANLLTLLANATSSLTQTTLEIRYRVELQGGVCTVTGL